MREQLASCLLVVRPSSFSFNNETSISNSFQARSSLPEDEVSAIALNEFDRSVEIIRNAGIELIIAEEDKTKRLPDSIFPNNWIANVSGKVILFPMLSPLRRNERDPKIIETVKQKAGVASVLDLRSFEDQGMFLEGTGSMVMDHDKKIIYACLSSRTHPDLLARVGEFLGYDVVKFIARDASGKDIYHTNVMMSVGSEDIVVCFESISSKKDDLVSSISKSGKNILEISAEQMMNYCANILNVRSGGSNFWVMSERAYNNFREDQLEVLSRHAKLLKLPLDVIEEVGGGSARCMLAEIFLPES